MMLVLLVVVMLVLLRIVMLLMLLMLGMLEMLLLALLHGSPRPTECIGGLTACLGFLQQGMSCVKTRSISTTRRLSSFLKSLMSFTSAASCGIGPRWESRPEADCIAARSTSSLSSRSVAAPAS